MARKTRRRHRSRRSALGASPLVYQSKVTALNGLFSDTNLILPTALGVVCLATSIMMIFERRSRVTTSEAVRNTAQQSPGLDRPQQGGQLPAGGGSGGSGGGVLENNPGLERAQ